MPKTYVERVGIDGFKKQPVGLGPYRFVSHTPGIELIMEAFEGYWRKTPSVKRLVFKSVPEATTRAAMLKRGEVDVAYLLDAPQARVREGVGREEGAAPFDAGEGPSGLRLEAVEYGVDLYGARGL